MKPSQIEIEILTLINVGWSHPFLDILMKTLSAEYTWAAFTLGLLVFLGSKKKWLHLLCLVWIGLIVALADMTGFYLLKPFFERLRPCKVNSFVRIVESCGGWESFPSNHSTNSAVVCIMAYAAWGRSIGIITMFFCFFVGLSRVYMGVHYPGDVLAGFIVGILWGGAGCFGVRLTKALAAQVGPG